MRQDTLSILILDDDAGDRKIICRALQQSELSCECVEAESLPAALEVCAMRVFDCAFVDYRLPGQDGMAAVAALHEKQPYIAIIMSTGQGDEMVATEAMQRGASDYLPKSLITAQSASRSAMRALEQVALRRKVAEQQEALESFARLMVHDLKEPLNSVQGFASLIEESVEQHKPKQITVACRLVVRAVERMSALIDTLHGYTQIESGVEFEPVEMREIMSDTLTDLDSLIHRRSARITHNELPAIFGNGPQLKQLLQNLIGNSIKFCDAPVPVVHISATRQEGNTWLFTLKDNGIGIPEESRRRIFDPFKRLHGLGKYEGTGLGLATCKRIVERHSGNIWCESHNDYGVTFSFTLPGSAGKPERTAPREPISIVRKLNPPLQAVQQRCQ